MRNLLKKIFNKLSTFNSHFSISKGFTLIELLVVIAVLGVLAAIVLLAVDPGEQFSRARDTSRISSVTQLGRSIQTYYTAKQTFPTQGTAWVTDLTTSGDVKANPAPPTYSGTLPVATTQCTVASYAHGGTLTSGFCYRADTTNGTAIVYARLESKLYNTGRCTGTDVAWSIFSTADGREGVVCSSTEPSAPAAAGTIVFTAP